MPKSGQGVSREGFCCDLTRKKLLHITFRCLFFFFFGTEKTCIIKFKPFRAFYNFSLHKIHCAALSNMSNSSASFWHLQVGVGAGPYLRYSSEGVWLKAGGIFSSLCCEDLVLSGNGKSAGRFEIIQHIKCP